MTYLAMHNYELAISVAFATTLFYDEPHLLFMRETQPEV